MVDGTAGTTYEKQEGRTRAREEWRNPHPDYEIPDELRIDPAYNRGQGATRVTEQLVQQLEALVLKGRTPEAAKAELFIVPRCWKQWRDNAHRGEQPYATMFERLKLARLRYEGRKRGRMDDISEHEDPNIAFKGVVKALEYANPEKYAPQTRNKTDVTVTMTAQINTQAIVALASLPAETVQMLANALTARPLIEQTAPTPLLSAFEDED
jgi:hypothetical protein